MNLIQINHYLYAISINQNMVLAQIDGASIYSSIEELCNHYQNRKNNYFKNFYKAVIELSEYDGYRKYIIKNSEILYDENAFYTYEFLTKILINGTHRRKRPSMIEETFIECYKPIKIFSDFLELKGFLKIKCPEFFI